MTKLTIKRAARLPDDLRVSRALSAPHLGPRILFFSGGSALNGISRQLKRYSYNSIHLITPFDSGGSSQILREAFDMPAVGDLRSRLMALADESELGQPDIYALFTYRFPAEASQKALRAEVSEMVEGRHPLIKAISQPMRMLICSFLAEFTEATPKTFDFQNASIGNLILAGGYLSNDRQLEPVLFLMSKMVDVRGTVRAVVDRNLHLGAELENGQNVFGQRQLSGKEAAPIDCSIRRLFLSDGAAEISAETVPLSKRNRKLIGQTDLICFPPGSLFSSVIANLLPAGVGRAVAGRDVPKVYIPSLGHDPEALGLSLPDQVEAILAPLMRDAGAASNPDRVMSHVLCDHSLDETEAKAVTARTGIPCVRLDLTGPDPTRYDPRKICETLISLV